jgi:chromosome segregation ATPase
MGLFKSKKEKLELERDELEKAIAGITQKLTSLDKLENNMEKNLSNISSGPERVLQAMGIKENIKAISAEMNNLCDVRDAHNKRIKEINTELLNLDTK